MTLPPRNHVKTLLNSNEEKAEVLSPKQFKDLLFLSGTGQQGIRNKSIIWHSFGSALRVTEIAKLRVKDVLDLNGNVLEMGTIPAKFSKSRKARLFVQIEEEQIETILNYVTYRVGHKLRVSGLNEFAGLTKDSTFYMGRKGTGFALNRKVYEQADGTVKEYQVCSSLQQLISGLIKRVGVKNGSSHSGRRTLATRLSERGVEDSIIQALLGHSDPNMTMSYIEPNIELIGKALSKIYQGL